MRHAAGRPELVGSMFASPATKSSRERILRIRIVRSPKAICIDGLQMDQFRLGQEYDVGWRFGSLMLLEGWAEPVGFEAPRSQTNDEPRAKAADTGRRQPRRKKR